MFRCKPFVTNCTTILLLSIIRTFVIFQTSFGVYIRPWLVVMFILSCITTISFNLYFKRVPCTSKNHRQTLTADYGGSKKVIWGKVECQIFNLKTEFFDGFWGNKRTSCRGCQHLNTGLYLFQQLKALFTDIKHTKMYHKNCECRMLQNGQSIACLGDDATPPRFGLKVIFCVIRALLL